MVLEQLTAQIFRHVSIKDEIIRRAILYWGHRKLDNKGRCWLAVFISKRPPNSPNLKRFKFIHWTITAETVRECNQRFLQQSSCIAFSFINELIGSLCKIRMESMLSILAIRTCSSSRFFQVSPCYIRCLSFFPFILSLSLFSFLFFFCIFHSFIYLFILLENLHQFRVVAVVSSAFIAFDSGIFKAQQSDSNLRPYKCFWCINTIRLNTNRQRNL